MEDFAVDAESSQKNIPNKAVNHESFSSYRYSEDEKDVYVEAHNFE